MAPQPAKENGEPISCLLQAHLWRESDPSSSGGGHGATRCQARRSIRANATQGGGFQTQNRGRPPQALPRRQTDTYTTPPNPQRKAAEQAERREGEYRDMLQDVLDGLSNTTGIMGETEYTLEYTRRIKDQKAKRLNSEWGTMVFDRMQARLQGQVDRRSPKSIIRRLDGQMNEYLHTTNTKIGVFRDVIIESDYNPLKAHESSIRIHTGMGIWLNGRGLPAARGEFIETPEKCLAGK